MILPHMRDVELLHFNEKFLEREQEIMFVGIVNKVASFLKIIDLCNTQTTNYRVRMRE